VKEGSRKAKQRIRGSEGRKWRSGVEILLYSTPHKK